MRVFYHTFGCKANQYDTERMRQEVEGFGAVTVAARDEADVVVVNTCTVTNQADADARRYVRRLRRENPGVRVVVAGCSAALKPDAYRDMEGVTGVVEGHDSAQVARVIGGGSADELVQIAVGAASDRLTTRRWSEAPLTHRFGATRAWLKVQDGCDRKCAFCATRLARGASRSRAPEEVVREAATLARRHPELAITGIHIGHYGIDLSTPSSLSKLVAMLLDEVPDVRFRLGSIEASEVDDELVDLLATSGGRLAPHLHMPLQSGADPVLKRMRRWHTREQYRRRTHEIADRLGPLGLGVDLITGFPGETDADHGATLRMVEELPFTYVHVFPFSPRNDTVAATLPDPVPQRVAGERSRELRALGQTKGAGYRLARTGGTARVVVEEQGRALTGDYLRVAVLGADEGMGAPPGRVRTPTRAKILEAIIQQGGESVTLVSSDSEPPAGVRLHDA